jgi:pimeloyl-ACP methyl ester carboxylesterase
MVIRRQFIDTVHGQIHYRSAGNKASTPLVMLHTNPGSSAMLEPLITPMSHYGWVVAPDTPGLGDSSELPQADPTIEDYAQATMQAINGLGIDGFNVYGNHTGANIALELAVQHPDRVKKVILDGIAFYTPEMKQDLLAHYAPDIKPCHDGTHLMWAWHFVRDQQIFWPWFHRNKANQRSINMPAAEELHGVVVDVLKAISSFQKAYRASFTYDKDAAFAQLTQPVMVSCPTSDIFFDHLERVISRIQNCKRVSLPGVDETDYLTKSITTFTTFLSS